MWNSQEASSVVVDSGEEKWNDVWQQILIVSPILENIEQHVVTAPLSSR